jgi:hypothetical protein
VADPGPQEPHDRDGHDDRSPAVRRPARRRRGTPDSAPQIRANYLEDEEDRRVTGSIVDNLRNVLAEEPLASEIEAEEFPGPEVTTP